jgi:hypothetical protein
MKKTLPKLDKNLAIEFETRVHIRMSTNQEL